MYLQQIYTGCLSEASYFIESNGEAAVIDPIRDTDSYLQIAKEHNAHHQDQISVLHKSCLSRTKVRDIRESPKGNRFFARE